MKHDVGFTLQKRGLPHAHILIWLVDKVRPEEIDKIIPAEIPDPNVDQELFDIVTTNMIHGTCGTLNMMSPCMDNGKCTKRFPKHVKMILSPISTVIHLTVVET